MIKQLVYLSPLPWASFAQRPHKFVEWFHASTAGRVLWVDPYPTRLPTLRDLKRPSSNSGSAQSSLPPWLEVVQLRCLPIEPLPGSTLINRLRWRSLAARTARLCAANPTLLAIGKPSALALDLLRSTHPARSVYDSMDDFPSFYTGVSRAALARTEEKIAREVSQILVSSSAIQARWMNIRPDAKLVYNGLDPAVLPAARSASTAGAGGHVIGYLGTMGAWFNWRWLVALAESRPADTVRLIGPMFVHPPGPLPPNVQVLPPLGHAAALKAMSEFDIGLIPFIRNQLTDGVDPIKYYEYRALGLPVISTHFGEMALRGDEPGTFLSDEPKKLSKVVDAALQYRMSSEDTDQFRTANSWTARFASAGMLQ
ncbi:glycosyl transferase [Paraburkholderia sp. GAS348]|uniref:glycosyl transferase n=1 Tax=Paraburkholderia sp. GAS348 TaxID=3035132 RepID=UPI003D216BD7